MNKDFLSVTEAARETGLSRTRILAIIHDGSGRLNAEKIGGVWIIPAGDVERFIESRTQRRK
jgi:excisionase family DNA binding protein